MQNFNNNIAVDKYGIDPEWLYQDFTIAGSDWGTLFSALLSHLHQLKQLEKYTDAIGICDVLLKYEEPYAEGGPFLIKSDCLIALGRLDDAIAGYEQYILKSNKTTDVTIKYAYYNLGNLYFELKRYSEAKEMFSNAYELDPQAGGPKGMLKEVETILASNSTK